MPAIPASSADEITGRRTARAKSWVEGAGRRAVGGWQVLDAPVVRQIKEPPRGVIETGDFGAGSVRAQEAPVGVEVPFAPWLCNCGGKCRGRLDSDQATDDYSAEFHAG